MRERKGIHLVARVLCATEFVGLWNLLWNGWRGCLVWHSLQVEEKQVAFKIKTILG